MIKTSDQGFAGAQHRRRLEPAGEQTVAPARQLGRGQQRDRLGGEVGRQVMADARDIAEAAAARLEAGLIVAERALHRGWRVPTIAAHHLLGALARRPEIENVSAVVGILDVVGVGEFSNPLVTVTVGGFHHPRARDLLGAAVTDVDERGDAEIVWLPAHRQFEPGGAGLQMC
jgi:hypothetical protein